MGAQLLVIRDQVELVSQVDATLVQLCIILKHLGNAGKLLPPQTHQRKAITTWMEVLVEQRTLGPPQRSLLAHLAQHILRTQAGETGKDSEWVPTYFGAGRRRAERRRMRERIGCCTA